jgi:hypothetical protein
VSVPCDSGNNQFSHPPFGSRCCSFSARELFSRLGREAPALLFRLHLYLSHGLICYTATRCELPESSCGCGVSGRCCSVSAIDRERILSLLLYLSLLSLSSLCLSFSLSLSLLSRSPFLSISLNLSLSLVICLSPYPPRSLFYVCPLSICD